MGQNDLWFCVTVSKVTASYGTLFFEIQVDWIRYSDGLVVLKESVCTQHGHLRPSENLEYTLQGKLVGIDRRRSLRKAFQIGTDRLGRGSWQTLDLPQPKLLP